MWRRYSLIPSGVTVCTSEVHDKAGVDTLENT